MVRGRQRGLKHIDKEVQQRDELLGQDLRHDANLDQKMVQCRHSVKAISIPQRKGCSSNSENLQYFNDENNTRISAPEAPSSPIPCRSSRVDLGLLEDAGDRLHKISTYGSSAPCRYTLLSDIEEREPTLSESKSVCEINFADLMLDENGQDSNWKMAFQDVSNAPQNEGCSSKTSSEPSVFVYPLNEEYQERDRLCQQKAMQEQYGYTADMPYTLANTSQPSFVYDSTWKKQAAMEFFQKQVYSSDTTDHTGNGLATGYPSDVLSTATMFVGCIGKNVTFKDLQRFFYDIDILHIQYRRSDRFAYITYKNYESMFNGVRHFHNRAFHDAVLQCYPVVPDIASNVANNDKNEVPASDTNICIQKMSTQRHTWTFPTTMADSVFVPPPAIYSGGPYLPSYLAEAPVSAWSNLTQRKRYIVLKPWSPEDLELSTQLGYWSVPRHKMDFLNSSFETCLDLYLIFSVTGSGEFSGYAKMLSPAIDIEESQEEGKITLEGTPFAVKGTPNRKGHRQRGSSNHSGANRKTRAWRYVFRLEWITKQRLSFHMVRHLHNAWDQCNPVRGSSDCTELETMTGDRLLQLFHTGESKD